MDQRHEVRDKVAFRLLPRLLPGRRCSASCGDGGGDGGRVAGFDSVRDGDGARVGHTGCPAYSAMVNICAPRPNEIAESLDKEAVAGCAGTGSCVAAKLCDMVRVVRHAMVDGRSEEGGADKDGGDGENHVQGQEAGG